MHKDDISPMSGLKFYRTRFLNDLRTKNCITCTKTFMSVFESDSFTKEAYAYFFIIHFIFML